VADPDQRDCQEFRAEVGHDRSKGARQCLSTPERRCVGGPE
jgi:hypothetical protein